MYQSGQSMRHAADVPAIRLISVREASARTGIPVRRIYKWVALGKVWSMKVSDRIMVHEDDVSEWGPKDIAS